MGQHKIPKEIRLLPPFVKDPKAKEKKRLFKSITPPGYITNRKARLKAQRDAVESNRCHGYAIIHEQKAQSRGREVVTHAERNEKLS